MSFNEANTVRDGIRDYLRKTGWTYISRTDLPRDETDVFVEPQLVEALKKINPEIAKNPGRADEVIYKLRAILLSVQSVGFVEGHDRMASELCTELGFSSFFLLLIFLLVGVEVLGLAGW